MTGNSRWFRTLRQWRFICLPYFAPGIRKYAMFHRPTDSDKRDLLRPYFLRTERCYMSWIVYSNVPRRLIFFSGSFFVRINYARSPGLVQFKYLWFVSKVLVGIFFSLGWIYFWVFSFLRKLSCWLANCQAAAVWYTACSLWFFFWVLLITSLVFLVILI